MSSLTDDNDEEWGRVVELLEGMEKQPQLKTADVNISSVSEILAALKVIMKNSMEKVFKLYLERHSLAAVSKYEDRPFVACVLMMDLEQGWGKQTRKSYFEQISELNTIAKQEAILPFLALDPRREDLYEMFLKAFCQDDSQFFGVKTYPSFGYAPSDDRLHPIYELCQEFNIPLTTHCGGTAVSTFHSPIVVQKCKASGSCDQVTISGNRTQVAQQLNEPSEWEYVLNIFPKLKVNLAHFGGSYVWDDYNEGTIHSRMSTINTLMSTYTGVYADFSFNLGDKNLDAAFLKGLNSFNIFRDRCMFGTDYWVVLPSANLADSTGRFLNHLNDYEEDLLTNNPKKFLFN